MRRHFGEEQSYGDVETEPGESAVGRHGTGPARANETPVREVCYVVARTLNTSVDENSLPKKTALLHNCFYTLWINRVAICCHQPLTHHAFANTVHCYFQTSNSSCICILIPKGERRVVHCVWACCAWCGVYWYRDKCAFHRFNQA